MKPQMVKAYGLRLLVVLGISVLFALLFNEVTYLLQKDKTDRSPHTIQLVIPSGTAALVQAGQNPPSIPSEMTFVTGDVLEVVNLDSVPHQLGPIWVPSGSTGRMVMEKADKLAYTCSFQTTQYFGLDVHAPTTLNTRLIALSFTAPTLASLLFIYSLLVFPVKVPEIETKVQGVA